MRIIPPKRARLVLLKRVRIVLVPCLFVCSRNKSLLVLSLLGLLLLFRLGFLLICVLFRRLLNGTIHDALLQPVLPVTHRLLTHLLLVEGHVLPRNVQVLLQFLVRYLQITARSPHPTAGYALFANSVFTCTLQFQSETNVLKQVRASQPNAVQSLVLLQRLFKITSDHCMEIGVLVLYVLRSQRRTIHYMDFVFAVRFHNSAEFRSDRIKILPFVHNELHDLPTP